MQAPTSSTFTWDFNKAAGCPTGDSDGLSPQAPPSNRLERNLQHAREQYIVCLTHSKSGGTVLDTSPQTRAIYAGALAEKQALYERLLKRQQAQSSMRGAFEALGMPAAPLSSAAA